MFRRKVKPIDFATHTPSLRNEILLTLLAVGLLAADLVGLAYL